MNRANLIKEVVLGGEVKLHELVAVARYGAVVSFNEDYKKRVKACRDLVEIFVKENRRIYGVTTGLGENVKRVIHEKEAIKYQRRALIQHIRAYSTPEII